MGCFQYPGCHKATSPFRRSAGFTPPIPSPRNQPPLSRVFPAHPKESAMKGIVAYVLGIPVVVIILLYVTDVF